MKDNKAIKVGKFISLVLRHSPEIINLDLDENGWANVNELIEKSKTKQVFFTKDELIDLVKNNDKQRYSFNDKGTLIRANQGHSIAVNLELKTMTPPDILYHGTASRFIDSIQKSGLDKQNRQFVHLSQDLTTATKVGSRHGKPVILSIQTSKMLEDGFYFYLSENGVWLTDSVPTTYIIFPEFEK